VFVQAEVVVDVSIEEARQALDHAIHDAGLIPESERAYGEGMSFLMPVGPRGARGLTKEVLVKLLPTRKVGLRTMLPLRWDATGSAGRLFPCLDANLALEPAGPDRTMLSVTGCYRPPLGAVGAALDRIVLSEVAAATLRALLEEISTKLTEQPPG
jgi:hypothetical protein